MKIIYEFKKTGFAFILLYLIFRFLLYIPWTMKFSSMFTPAFIAWGLMLMICDLITTKYMFKSKYSILLIIYMILFGITILLNINNNLFGNISSFIFVSIQLFYLYPKNSEESRENVRKQVITISYIIILVTFISVVASMKIFLEMRYIQLGDIPAWGKILGFVNGRLYGIYVDPNIGSLVAIISLFLSILCIYYCNKKFIAIVLYLNILLQTTYIFLSGSRTGLVCLSLGMTWFMFILINKNIIIKIKSRIKAIVISAFSSIIIVFLMLIIGNKYEEMLLYLPSIYDNISKYAIEDTTKVIQDNDIAEKNDPMEENAKFELIKTDNNRLEIKNDISNGRIALLKEGYTIFTHHPLFGIGKYNIQHFAKQYVPNGNIALLNFTTHNGYLELLLSNGLFGSLILLLFIFLCTINIIKQVYLVNSDKNYFVLLILSCILFAFILCAVFLAEIFLSNSFISTLFWLYLGYALYFIQTSKKENKINNLKC